MSEIKYENTLSLFLKRSYELSERPCFYFKRDQNWQSLTWKQVRNAVFAVAVGLQAKGIRAGDAVSILSHTRYEWTILDLAILMVGGVTVPIYQSNTPEEIAYVLKHADVSLVFVEETQQFLKVESIKKTVPSLKQICSIEPVREEIPHFEQFLEEYAPQVEIFEKNLPDLSLDAPATIVYTSGTTGEPKGVVLTHRNLAAHINGLYDVLPATPEEHSLLFLPLAHIFARSMQFFQLCTGYSQSYAESIDKLVDNIQERHPLWMVAVPRIFEKIYAKVQQDLKNSIIKQTLFSWALGVGKKVAELKSKHQGVPLLLSIENTVAQYLVFQKLRDKLGGQIRFLISGGAPLPLEIAEFFSAAELLVLEGYGLTETFSAITCNYVHDYRFGTVGKKLGDVEIKIAEDGEILAKGTSIFKKYHKNPKASAEVFTDDGFFKTGDIGEIDSDGFLKITDRKKDLIITSGGKNIAPQPIENALKLHPLISQALVHGDRRKFLSALITLDPDALKAWAKKENLDPTLSHSERVKSPAVFEAVRQIVEEQNKLLPGYETIKRFAILEKDFSLESGELTPSLKMKRKVIAERYKEILDSFYRE